MSVRERSAAKGCGRDVSSKRGGMRLDLSLSTNLVQDDIPVEVLPGLFLGSKHAAFNQQALDDAQITHIINVANIPATYPEHYCYLTVSIRDKDGANLLSCIPTTNEFIKAALGNNGRVLIHCSYGASRSPALIVAYLMCCKGMRMEDAIALVKSKRNVSNINQGFKSQLEALEEANFNVHLAHNYILRQRLDIMARAWSNSCAGGTQRQGRGGLRKATSDISGIRVEQDRHRNQCKQLLTAVRAPPIIQLLDQSCDVNERIPPLQSMDLQFVCRTCFSVLFYANNVVKPLNGKLPSFHTRRRESTPVRTHGNETFHSSRPQGQLGRTYIESKLSSTLATQEEDNEYEESNVPPTPSSRARRAMTFGNEVEDGADEFCESKQQLDSRLRAYSSETSSKVCEAKHSDETESASSTKFYTREELLNGEAANRWGNRAAQWGASVESKGSSHSDIQQAVIDTNDAIQTLCNDTIFTEPLDWMSEWVDFSTDKSVLRCYNCMGKVGGMSWNGMETSWGERIVPAFYIDSAKVGAREMCESSPLEPPRKGRKNK